MLKYKAFTLIEIIISMGILALVVSLTVGILISVVRSYQKQRIISEIERNGDFVVRTVEENLRGAQNIECIRYNGTPVSTPGAAFLCDLGQATDGGRLLRIQNGEEERYLGLGGSGAAECADSDAANCYVYWLTSRAQISGTTLTSTNFILTNSALTNGVNVYNLDVTVDGGTDGNPHNITVTMDVRGPINAPWSELESESRTFQTFLTLRGSYE